MQLKTIPSAAEGNDLRTSGVRFLYPSFRNLTKRQKLATFSCKVMENMVLVYQRERCINILYTPFPLLYDYDLEWKTDNY